MFETYICIAHVRSMYVFVTSTQAAEREAMLLVHVCGTHSYMYS